MAFAPDARGDAVAAAEKVREVDLRGKAAGRRDGRHGVAGGGEKRFDAREAGLFDALADAFARGGDEPADFDAFWAEAKARLATVPFDDASVELVDVTPAAIAGSFTVYAAKIPCYGPRPVTGWLTIPEDVPEGGLPVQANFDGYGCVSAAPSPPTWGVSGQIRFAVNAHGYDLVGHDDQYYKDFNDSISKTNRTFNGTTYNYGLAPQDYDNPSDTMRPRPWATPSCRVRRLPFPWAMPPRASSA